MQKVGCLNVDFRDLGMDYDYAIPLVGVARADTGSVRACGWGFLDISARPAEEAFRSYRGRIRSWYR